MTLDVESEDVREKERKIEKRTCKGRGWKKEKLRWKNRLLCPQSSAMILYLVTFDSCMALVLWSLKIHLDDLRCITQQCLLFICVCIYTYICTHIYIFIYTFKEKEAGKDQEVPRTERTIGSMESRSFLSQVQHLKPLSTEEGSPWNS